MDGVLINAGFTIYLTIMATKNVVVSILANVRFPTSIRYYAIFHHFPNTAFRDLVLGGVFNANDITVIDYYVAFTSNGTSMAEMAFS